ncbi:MAG: hypothetical protein U1D55_10390 [Phycisphaerae bacterium]
MLNKRLARLGIFVASGGLLLQSGCDVADAVLATIAYAFDIVSVWL